MAHIGTITLAGKQYQASVVNGVRLIDGIVFSEFIENLIKDGNNAAIRDLTEIGIQGFKDKATGEKKETYQAMAHEKHQQRNN